MFVYSLIAQEQFDHVYSRANKKKKVSNKPSQETESARNTFASANGQDDPSYDPMSATIEECKKDEFCFVYALV